MRSAQQVIEAIHAARFTGRKVGLENTRALMDRLHIATTVPAIHVAGTNGKGSVCAMVERVLSRPTLRPVNRAAWMASITCCALLIDFPSARQCG